MALLGERARHHKGCPHSLVSSHNDRHMTRRRGRVATQRIHPGIGSPGDDGNPARDDSQTRHKRNGVGGRTGRQT
jgi:hypothetical protein